MPGVSRIRSKSGIYHIIMRGINCQTIFEDEEDCEKFIETLKKYKEACGYELYAYCLMEKSFAYITKGRQGTVRTSDAKDMW